MESYSDSTKLASRCAMVALLLLILFVGIIPVYLEVTRMPTSKQPDRPPSIKSWPTWPAHLSELYEGHTTPGLVSLYDSMSRFANRSAFPMEDLERTITHVEAGSATTNDLYHFTEAALAGANDEEDALVGLVIPTRLRNNSNVAAGWHEAQEAAYYKVKALRWLAENGSQPQAWNAPEYRASLQQVSQHTHAALNDIRALN